MVVLTPTTCRLHPKQDFRVSFIYFAQILVLIKNRLEVIFTSYHNIHCRAFFLIQICDNVTDVIFRNALIVLLT